MLLTGRFNAAGARLADSVLKHGVELHIRYLLLKSGFLRRKVVLQGGYLALQLVDVNALEALERFLRRVELRLVVVTGCPDFLNLADGLVVFAELLFKLGFLFLRTSIPSSVRIVVRFFIRFPFYMIFIQLCLLLKVSRYTGGAVIWV